ncbi:prefoldin subunit beta [Candidatus Woesearchaeota archaeon]|nr:prefoldin subunit beta [Candidatus Woesearchaeota archaeon]MBW3005869.1 prefoldin subunit beta [Candidatus Woesearchaeota archaeon]
MTEAKDNAAQENIGRLQMIEQQVQTMAMQKQQFQSQLFEVENALKELKTSKTAYKIVGNIMVLSDKEKLEKDLKQKKEIIDLRITNIDKEEKKLKEKAKKLQEELLSKLKKK